jgi:hypothetical protein
LIRRKSEPRIIRSSSRVRSLEESLDLRGKKEKHLEGGWRMGEDEREEERRRAGRNSEQWITPSPSRIRSLDESLDDLGETGDHKNGGEVAIAQEKCQGFPIHNVLMNIE